MGPEKILEFVVQMVLSLLHLAEQAGVADRAREALAPHLTPDAVKRANLAADVAEAEKFGSDEEPTRP